MKTHSPDDNSSKEKSAMPVSLAMGDAGIGLHNPTSETQGLVDRIIKKNHPLFEKLSKA